MTRPVWITEPVVRAIHHRQIAEHGGVPGILDEGLLASALARAPNLLGYGSPDMADLAAAYGYGLVRNHPFLDGNKRVSFVVTLLFLRRNSHDLHAASADKLRIWLALAEGSLAESDLAKWLRAHLIQVNL